MEPDKARRSNDSRITEWSCDGDEIDLGALLV